jgi:menaquinone-dependent protoporphyrinogen oxidase
VRILVSGASRHDATADIATRIGLVLESAGLDVTVAPPASVESIEGYDAIVLGSGVYIGRWLGDANDFVDRFRSGLIAKPVWLFSSGPLGSPEPKPAGEPEGMAELASAIYAQEHRTFAGRLDRARLGLGEKAITRVVGAPYGDFRDWEVIDAWARGIADELAREPAAAG